MQKIYSLTAEPKANIKKEKMDFSQTGNISGEQHIVDCSTTYDVTGERYFCGVFKSRDQYYFAATQLQ